MSEIAHHDVSLGDVTLRVTEAGDPAAPAIVLCHGFPELAFSWRHQVPVLADVGYHVLAPDQRGYGWSSAPSEVSAYGIEHLTGDLVALLDARAIDRAVFVGHDWGALIVWQMAQLHPDRVRAVIGVSVPFVQWPAPPTELMRAMYGDRFFYMLYFQQQGPPEAELDADPRATMAKVLYGASGTAMAARQATAELPPMAGTGFLTGMPVTPALPFAGPEGPWLTEEDLDVYGAAFAHSGFFGPVSYYRNLDANHARTEHLGPQHVTMPSGFITGSLDPVNLMDPGGVERMQATLPDFRGHRIIEGAGHWTQQEAPGAFNAALVDLLAAM